MIIYILIWVNLRVIICNHFCTQVLILFLLKLGYNLNSIFNYTAIRIVHIFNNLFNLIPRTFDFDHNRCVDQKEFLGFFVVTALVKGQTFPIDNPTLLGSLCQWLQQFHENLFVVIGEYESALFRGSLPDLTSDTDMETS